MENNSERKRFDMRGHYCLNKEELIKAFESLEEPIHFGVGFKTRLPLELWKSLVNMECRSITLKCPVCKRTIRISIKGTKKPKGNVKVWFNKGSC